MSEPGVREIQLSGKQLAFAFIVAIVVAMAVFLLGVSVGRGTPGASTPATTTAEVAPPAELPPPTTLAPEDTKFDATLQGKTTTPEPEPAPAPVEPVVNEPTAPAPSVAASAPPAPAPAPAAASVAKPTATPTPAPATAKPAPAGQQGWMLQAGAFRSRENADVQVRQLIAKGYSAVVVTGGSLFRVRVGPYADRGAADRAAARLAKEENIKASVTR